jgi:hypothetical protein
MDQVPLHKENRPKAAPLIGPISSSRDYRNLGCFMCVEPTEAPR